jgi:hypothetical protein
MTRFVQMLALGGKLPDGTQFLSPATLRAALVNRTPGAGTNSAAWASTWQAAPPIFWAI